jgi:hypothetical protein
VASSRAEQDGWVRRVLGLSVPGLAGGRSDGPVQDWVAARQAWQDANDAVNDQINGLRRVLLNRAKTGEDDADEFAEQLIEIAEQGLNAVTENHRVKLMAAVMSLGDGGGGALAKNGPTALSLIEAFTAFLAGSEKIEVCDANPFGAPVSIRATLTPPLQQMAAALQAGLKQ